MFTTLALLAALATSAPSTGATPSPSKNTLDARATSKAVRACLVDELKRDTEAKTDVNVLERLCRARVDGTGSKSSSRDYLGRPAGLPLHAANDEILESATIDCIFLVTPTKPMKVIGGASCDEESAAAPAAAPVAAPVARR